MIEILFYLALGIGWLALAVFGIEALGRRVNRKANERAGWRGRDD